MMIPIRCFSCGKPVAQCWEAFQERVAKGESKKEALDSLGLTRYCCRMMFIGHVDLVDISGRFKKF